MRFASPAAHLLLVAAAAVAACGPSAHPAGPGGSSPGPRHDLQCTPQQADAEPQCAARGDGCALGPPLACYGTEPPEEVIAERQRALEAASMPCDCICPRDLEMCAEVP